MSQELAHLDLEPCARRAHYDPVVDCSDSEDMAVQSYKNDVDINTIVRRFGVIEELPSRAASAGEFGDFTSSVDFHQAMNQLTEAQRAFEALPAKLRARFENDPGKFLDYVHSADNVAEAVELGILDKSALAQPVGAEPAGTGTEGAPAS